MIRALMLSLALAAQLPYGRPTANATRTSDENVDYQLFRARFFESASIARAFAQKFVRENLPRDCRFHLHLNQSHDAHASPDAVLFPDDETDEKAFLRKHLTADKVIETLWRDSLVPEWVNLNVTGETGSATIIDVAACGRFVADEGRLYHQNEGRAPFHVLGPELPYGHVNGETFDLCARTTCWTLDDLNHALDRAEKVVSLRLFGPAFPDDLLSTHLRFPKLELLELAKAPVSGPGLKALTNAPQLRVLRISCGPIDQFDLSSLPVMPSVGAVFLSNLPARTRALECLAKSFPQMTDLSLSSLVSLCSGNTLVLPNLNSLRLDFPDLGREIYQVRHLKSLSLNLRNALPEQVEDFIRSARESLSSVSLRGTPVTDRILSTLASVPNLSYVDLVDTKVTQGALETHARKFPNLKYFPRPTKTSRDDAV